MDEVMTVERARKWLYRHQTSCGPITAWAIVVLLADHARLVAKVQRLERNRTRVRRQDEVREARGWREPRT